MLPIAPPQVRGLPCMGFAPGSSVPGKPGTCGLLAMRPGIFLIIAMLTLFPFGRSTRRVKKARLRDIAAAW